jgi:protein arginine kinase
MSDKLNLQKSGWFDENGSENDVIVSSRICLSRNIKKTLFPSKMDRITEEYFYDTVKDAVRRLGEGTLVKISALDHTEKKLLSERRYIKSGASFEREPSIFVPDNEKYVIVFNQKDHIRIKSFKGGLDLRTAYNTCNNVDNILEEKLTFAWSEKFGYLTSSLTETGTGMKSSVMLYLPAIVRNGKIDKVMKDVVQAGLSVTGFVGEGENSSGDLYIIENQFSMGETEENIIKKIETVSLMLTDFERDSRNFLYRKDPDSLEDEIMRAYGLLKYCRKLSIYEAEKNLSLLKLGKYLNIINEGSITYSLINCLLIEIQKAHLNKAVDKYDDTDMKRAEIVKTKLFKGMERCSKD